MAIYDAIQEIEKDNTKIFTNGDIVLKYMNGKIAICDNSEDECRCSINEIDLKATWVEIRPQPKLVTFIEVLNSSKDCWVEHPYINCMEYPDNDRGVAIHKNKRFRKLIYRDSQPIKDVLYILGLICDTNDSFMDIIKNGKWYIEG